MCEAIDAVTPCATPIRNTQSRIRDGFTLVEILISIMLLGLGLTAVASLFPVAGAMQRSTMDDLTAMRVGGNGKALLKARGVPLQLMRAALNEHEAGTVVNLAHLSPAVQNAWAAAWPMADRSYPTTLPVEQRRFYFTPLFRRDMSYPEYSPAAWEVYLYVLKAPEGAPIFVPPDPVTGQGGDPIAGDRYLVTGGGAAAGDMVVDGRTAERLGGDPRIVTLIRDEPDETRWHGANFGGKSVALNLIVFDGGVVR